MSVNCEQAVQQELDKLDEIAKHQRNIEKLVLVFATVICGEDAIAALELE